MIKQKINWTRFLLRDPLVVHIAMTDVNVKFKKRGFRFKPLNSNMQIFVHMICMFV